MPAFEINYYLITSIYYFFSLLPIAITTHYFHYFRCYPPIFEMYLPTLSTHNSNGTKRKKHIYQGSTTSGCRRVPLQLAKLTWIAICKHRSISFRRALHRLKTTCWKQRRHWISVLSFPRLGRSLGREVPHVLNDSRPQHRGKSLMKCK
jgi:hypothetical protein